MQNQKQVERKSFMPLSTRVQQVPPGEGVNTTQDGNMSIDKSLRQTKRSADFSQRSNQHKSGIQSKRFVIDTNNS